MYSDIDLMVAISRGDMDQFSVLVTRHQQYVWKLAYRFIGDYHEAEDIACEAFLRILDAAPRYRPTGSFRAYLCLVTTRLCLDRTKKKRPLYFDQIPDSVDPNPFPDETYEQQQLATTLCLALNRLPPRQRMAVILCYYQELNHAQLAAVMNTTSKAVEHLLARAKQNLKYELRDYLKEDLSQTGGLVPLTRLFM